MRTRFIVIGGMMELIAELQVTTWCRDSAVIAWAQHFGDQVHSGWILTVIDERENPNLIAEHWKGEGESYWSGPYNYDMA